MWSPEEEVGRCDLMGETPARVVFAVMALVASLCFAATGLAVASGSPFERSPTASPPSPSVNITLHGDAGLGFGFGSTNITNPGPTLIIHVGDYVSLTLIAHDSLNHTWFIDYNNDTAVSAGERESPPFYPGHTIVWKFTADRTGNYTYRCGIHPTSMTGLITIIGTQTPPPLPLTVPLITAIMLGGLGVVFVFAAAYHVRAVQQSKRK